MAGRDEVHVALLRGINVGGRHRLPMQALVEAFERSGARDVRTYIQSGNVVFHGTSAVRDRVAAVLAARLGFEVPVILRTAAALRAAALANPFLKAGADPSHLHVAFLAAVPGKGAAQRLDPQRSPPDAFALRGDNLYLLLPRGVAPTRLTNAYLDATLGTTSTVRSFKTVQALVALSS